MSKKAKPRKQLWSARRGQWVRRDPRLWMAVGALAAYSANSQTVQAPVQATPTPGYKGAEEGLERARTLPVRRFDIPPGPLDVVATALEHATGIHVDVTNPALRKISSPGVSGLYSDDQAIRSALRGTGLVYRFVGPLSVLVDLAGVTSSVTVMAGAGPAVASSPKYTAPVLDTPQTINSIEKQTIADQGATTLRDALRNFAGISLAAGEGGSQGDNLTIRGFTARNDIFLDGMRDFGSYYRDPFNLEEVQVLEGPSSVTFGRGSTGGVVNQETKVPGLDRFISGTLQFGTDQTKRVTADINQPIAAWGSGSAFRLNVMGDEGNVAGRDGAETRRFGVAPSLAIGLGKATRWTFSYMHQTGDDIPDYGLPWLFNGPASVNRSNYYGFGGDYLRTYDDVGTAKVEHDFGPHLTLRNEIRYANYERDARITEPQIANAISPSTPLEDLVVNRHEIAVNSVETALDDQLDITAHLKTGFAEHTIVTGVEAIRETSDPTRPTYANVPATGLLAPDESQIFSGVATITSQVHTTASTFAGYVLDDVKLGRNWEFTGGLRLDRFDADYRQTVAPASAFSRVDLLPSWRGAVVFKPSEKGSIYVSAGTSSNPSAETLALSAGTANLPPEKNLTYELGTKWDLLSSKLSLRGSLFRTDKTNAREPDPADPTLYVLAGNQRVNGFELDASGHLTDRWQLLLGYAYLDGRIVSSNYYPQSVGAQLANVPENTFNFWSTYRLAWHHMDLGVGGQFVDSRTASSTAPFDSITGLVKRVPSYWVFNAMARYPISDHLDLQANVYNIANRFYYDQLHPAHIIPGAARSALIGLNFRF